ncbi:c6 transcription factor [Fusarium austroafricanum]|uniref:C6 transcription factor n=1 Tax=Fusarium austroafricanum TaxID=2364996 RepID=A0A8H4NUP0_9HYPO|nr:c6 transcription factor [Fusarium austroafricanum]
MSSNAIKARRVTQACDFCHHRGLKCRPASSTSTTNSQRPCQTCREFGEECTRNRRPKKRGTKKQTVPVSKLLASNAPATSSRSEPSDEKLLASETFALEGIKNRKIITELLDIYLDTVHPMFPLFCEREIWVGWRDGSFPADALDYMNLVCMCALSALHANYRALFTDAQPSSGTSAMAQAYLSEAETLVAERSETAGPVHCIRSYGFLALVGAQSGNSALLHKYMGLFHTIVSRSNFHDESTWPQEISDCEREVRRRLWLLEHAVLNLRFRHRKRNSILEGHYGPDISQIMERLSELQGQIVPQFGSAATRSSDSGRNRCGFQACNILCTIHLARMMTSLASHQGIQVACQAAQDTMCNISAIPEEYIRATGSPLLQQLAGVGYILLNLAKKDTAFDIHYSTFQQVMNSIVEFLARFSKFSKLAAAARERLSLELAEFEKYPDNLQTCEPVDTDVSRYFEPCQQSMCFDMFAFPEEEGDQDFLNANLLRSFI